jgi:hypothetical protein
VPSPPLVEDESSVPTTSGRPWYSSVDPPGQGGEDPLADHLRGADGVDDDQAAALPVVVEQRPRPGDEHRQPVADHPLLVVAPPAAQQPAPQLVVGNLQVAGRVEGGGARLQVAVQRLGLADGPREAVQDEAVCVPSRTPDGRSA